MCAAKNVVRKHCTEIFSDSIAGNGVVVQRNHKIDLSIYQAVRAMIMSSIFKFLSNISIY